MLAILASRAKTNDHFKGLVPNLVEDGLSILRYADDTIVFMENTTTQNLLHSVWVWGTEAGGLVAHLGYSRQDSQASNRLG